VSDHRGICCDLSPTLFTNVAEEMMLKTRQIGINSSNKEGERFIRFLNQQLSNHRVYEKINQLNIWSKLCGINGVQDKMNYILHDAKKLDKVKTDAMLLVDRKCCKPKEVALWSSELYQSN
jgi:hypothetical protein